MLIRNSELVIYEKDLSYKPQYLYRKNNKIVLKTYGGISKLTYVYDVSRLSTRVPTVGMSLQDFTRMSIDSVFDEYVAIRDIYSKDERYTYAERVISVFSSSGKGRLAMIYIYIVKDSDEIAEYNRNYEYMDDPSLKMEIEKYAEGKYNLHITYRNNKIDKIEKKGR